MSTASAEVIASVNVWRDSLVGLSGQSPLVKFRAPKASSLRFSFPASDKIFALLYSGEELTISGTLTSDSVGEETELRLLDVDQPNDDNSDADLISERPHSEVHTVARNLMRKASAFFLDRGVPSLYLSFGLLNWKETDGSAMTSPLFLIPVELNTVGPRSTPRLSNSEDDAVVNPALKLRLAEFEIELPTAEELEGSSLGEVYGRLKELLRAQDVSKDWTIRDETHLAMFSFQKEAMYKDLLDNEALVQAHSAVQCLATSDPAQQSAEFQFDPIDPSDIDRQAPPETIPLVLDADSSQRAAIAAALQGRSFVMDGPPGTGKSQTIANMIGALLHAGKTVLFVSEKIAALDVVRNRLESVGLGSYLLELHSHKVARREVAQELLKTLDNAVVAPTAMSNISRSKARNHRERLNDYAQAMNEVRQPLNMSLHDVLGTYSRLSSEHSAPVPDTDSSVFSESQLGEVQDALSRIARAWRPATERSTFLWTDVVDNQPLELRLQHALTALRELLGRRKPHFSVAEAYSTTALDDTPKLVSLLEHLQSMPDESVVQRWLIADGLDELREKRSLLAGALSDLNSAAAAVSKIVDVDWTELPSITSPMPEVQLPASSPSSLDFDSLSSDDLNALAEQFSTQSRMLRQHSRSLQHHAQTVGWHHSESFTDAKMIHQLVNLRALNASPMPRWFSAAGIAAARTTAAQLHSDISQLDHAEGVARNLYSADALHAPLGVLNDRFTNLHKGLRKLSGAYRMDKKAVISLLNDASRVKDGIRQLSSAIEWSELVSRFEDQHQERKSLLGHFYRGRQTDFQQLERALVVAERVLQVTGPAPSEAIVAYQVGYGDISAQHSAVNGLVTDLDTWASGLRPAPEISGRPELQFGTFDEAVNWFEAHVEPAKNAATRITALGKATDKQPRNWLEAERLIAARNLAADSLNRIEDAAESFRNILGEYYKAADTDLNQLDSAMSWTFRMRELVGSRLTHEQLHAIVVSRASHGLGNAYTEWTAARDSVVTAFAASRHDEFLTEFNDQLTAEELLRALIDDSEGQQEWFAYRQAYNDLAEFGLDVAVEYCSRHRLSPEEVSDVVMRALYRGWADAIIASDSRLSPQLSNERAALVEEYRQLDEQFVSAAISEIITAANSRRPTNTSVGESAVIRREGAKQRRHRPVRDLIASTRSITPRIKPVFMMSPLAVSQYLPPEQLFDVVIFDEASQIPPGDAINCIYRAGSVILAGDDKQLPPTSFFERGVDETEDEDTDVKDFQSVLELAKASGAFNNLKLSWHYRSRHEDLIAFSNYKFYEGKLVTFPSAEQTSSNVGVEFYKVDGVYRRGGGADNPIEAAKIAERIIEHYSSRPDLTLGVVTFSVAQSDSVQRALDEARLDRRDLDRFFNTEDRLDGFFIRALEQVQGDERDVIIFSVGYGPDEAGKISTHFGALNRDKGWRRLNVGITRARQRVEVVSSMHAGEIPPSTNENVEHLRNYLDYAERGQKVLAIPQSTTGLDPESPFEESVIVTIRSWGYIVEPQVGAAGYRIDLGVRHPQLPGSFAIGVECDGYQYHSAPSARDRDRLRDQILGGLGWRLHRIWGTSWYRDRSAEEQRLKTAIELAISQTSSCRTTLNRRVERPSVMTEQVVDFATPDWVQTYKAAPADFSTPDWIDAGEPDAANYMIGQIESIAEAEGPVHLDLVDDRIRYWWNIGRIGSKIRRNINLAIDAADVEVDGEFLVPTINNPVAVRSPTKIADRKIDHVHLQELAIAAKKLLVDAGDMSRDELSSAISQIYEWRRRGSNVESRISEALNLLVKNGEAAERGGKLSAPRRETAGDPTS